ncbi:MAG: maleylpyruvate isomerase family mycothiol-dependent enzyme [Actinomycetes bacterium]
MKPNYPYALRYDRYRELMAEDFERLLEVTASAESRGQLGTQIPACPEWDIEQLARHTALVYLQKAETVRTGSKPQGRWIPEEILQLGPADILSTCYQQLTSQFDSHEPSDPAESWVAGDQTVGFWIRRLTHETAVHRYDAEAALGDPQPIDTELAVDGIDEVLTVMFDRGRAAQGADAVPAGVTGSLVLESGGKTWSVRLLPTDVDISRDAGVSSDTVITGTPNDLLLWLWGRGPLPPGSDEGGIPAELRRRLAATT